MCQRHEHCWIHWIDDKGFAICLDEDQDGSPYNGRNWYPYSKELDEAMAGRNALTTDAKRKYWTMQYSVPISKLALLVQVMTRVSASIKGRTNRAPPFEFKFMKDSGRTLHAPNSGGVSGEGWIALNVWWECVEEDLLELRRELRGLEGSRVHYGKYHRGTIPRAVRQVAVAADKDKSPKTISVILPVYNALPYLQLSVRDILKQDVGGGLELIVSDDCSADGSFEWLCALCGEMRGRGEQRYKVERSETSFFIHRL